MSNNIRQRSNALELLQEKLEFLQKERATTSDASQKFDLNVKIRETSEEILELQRTPKGSVASVQQLTGSEVAHHPTPSTANAAMYWQDGEGLVPRAANRWFEGEPELAYTSSQPMAYLRVWPDMSLEELSATRLKNIIVSPLFANGPMSLSQSRNRYGCITYPAGLKELVSSTQLFKNREIWGVESYTLRPREGPEFNFVPIADFEDGMIGSLKVYLTTAFETLGYPDLVHLESGLVNVDGFRLYMPHTHLSRAWGRIFDPVHVTAIVKKNDADSSDAALVKMFEAVFEAAGVERPEGYNGFPAS